MPSDHQVLSRSATIQLLNYLKSGYAVYLIRTTEESRCARWLSVIARDWFKKSTYCYSEWDICSGWTSNQDSSVDNKTSPMGALKFVNNSPRCGFYVLKDFLSFCHKPDAVRHIKNFGQSQGPRPKKVLFLLSSAGNLPDELTSDVILFDLPGPDAEEIDLLVDNFLRTYDEFTLIAGFKDKLALALRGLKESAIERLFSRVWSLPPDHAIKAIHSEKERLVREEGFLEFIPPKVTLEDLGGLDNFKIWLEERQIFFINPKSIKQARFPKGVLIMGVSGSGKSLAIKTISDTWNLPLFRLKMGSVYAGPTGPEERFTRCLKLVEQLAPVIIWIDEIEKSLTSDEMTGAKETSNSRIFSEFLTWMEEKPEMVFVAATANRVKALPAELIRKGRFDQVFFVDLPTPAEAQEIFRIHLRRSGLESTDFDLAYLATLTRGWSGSEIEELVNSTVIEALSNDHTVTDAHLIQKIEQFVPLSQTYPSQISDLQRFQGGTPASRYSTRVSRRTNSSKLHRDLPSDIV